MFEAALWVIAAAAMVVVLAPLDVTFAAERTEAFRATIGIRWIFFRWSTDVRRPAGKQRPRKTKKKASRTGIGQAFRIFQAVPDKFGVLRAFLLRLRRAVRCRGLRGELHFGTGDPADTGRLWGIAAPLLSWIHDIPAIEIIVTPNFVEAGVTGSVRGAVRVYPSLIVWSLARLVVSPAAVRFGLAVLRERRSA